MDLSVRLRLETAADGVLLLATDAGCGCCCVTGPQAGDEPAVPGPNDEAIHTRDPQEAAGVLRRLAHVCLRAADELEPTQGLEERAAGVAEDSVTNRPGA